MSRLVDRLLLGPFETPWSLPTAVMRLWEVDDRKRIVALKISSKVPI